MFEIAKTKTTFTPGVNTNCKIATLELVLGERSNRLKIELEKDGKKVYGSLWEPTSYQGKPIEEWQERKVSEFITSLCEAFIPIEELKEKVQNSINFADFVTKALKAIDGKWQNKDVDVILTYQKNTSYLEIPNNLVGIDNKSFIKLSSDNTKTLGYTKEYETKHMTKVEAPAKKVTEDTWLANDDVDALPF